MNWIKLKSESITSYSTIQIASLSLQLMREELGGGRAMSRAAVIFPGMHIPQEVYSLKGNRFWIWHFPSLDWLQWLVVEQCLAASSQRGLHVCIHINNRTHCCKDQHMTTEQGPLYIKVADINQQRIFPQKCPSQISFIHERWMSPLLHHQLIIEVWVFTPGAEHQNTTWVLSWHQLSGFETKENKPEHLEQHDDTFAHMEFLSMFINEHLPLLQCIHDLT